ncbi:MAG TPA: ABC transporter permease subunit [Verrucomicrobiae bacterium]|nr:ABC transporter permease subunit [Verrucomicrobiae bacterium]
MTFLPIIERELRLRARGRSNYWARAGVGFAALLTGLPPLLWTGPWATPANVGRSVFNGMVASVFVLSCVACLLTADVISSEAREGTLGLLLLTRVRRVDVLLGKFAANGLAALFALMAFVPVLVVPVLAGGVTGGEAFRKTLVLLVTLLLALSVGIWASSRWRERFRTNRGAMFLLLALVLGPAMVGVVWRGLGWQLAGPLGALTAAGDLAFQKAPGQFWVSMGVNLSLASLLLIAASHNLQCRLLETEQVTRTPVTRPSPDSLPVDSLAQAEEDNPARSIFDDPNAPLKPLPPPISRPDSHPLQWLLNRQRGLGPMLWLGGVIGLVSHAWVWPFARFVPMRSFGLLSLPISLITAGITGALFAWAASRFFLQARRSGELELLLTTPVGAREMISAQWATLKRLLVGPVALMGLPIVLQGMGSVFGGYNRGDLTQFYSLFFIILGILNLLLGTAALCWLGMWFGSRTEGQARAILWSVGLARGMPFLINIGFGLLWNWGFGLTSRGLGSSYWLIVALGPQILYLGLYIIMIRVARLNLYRELSGAEPMPMREALSLGLTRYARALGQARHWTPS